MHLTESVEYLDKKIALGRARMEDLAAVYGRAHPTVINYSHGEVVFDPFAGLFTVPVTAVKMGRKGYGIELNSDYFRDGVGYLKAAEAEICMPTLFDFLAEASGE